MLLLKSILFLFLTLLLNFSIAIFCKTEYDDYIPFPEALIIQGFEAVVAIMPLSFQKRH